jgi:hypothetical protein
MEASLFGNALAAPDDEEGGNGAGNPMRRSRRRRKLEHILERDSDAVTSVFHPEQRKIGALLSTADGGSSPLCYAVQAACAGMAVMNFIGVAQMQAKKAGMAQPNMLLYISAVLNGLTWLPLALIVGSARDALRSGGALDQLKVGEVKIGAKDSSTLSKWRMVLGVFSALWLLLALVCFATAIIGREFFIDDDMTQRFRFTNVLGGVIFGAVLPVAFSGWMHSMFTASYLCRDDVIEVVKNINSADPTSEEWEERVAQPALGLIEKIVLLSDGWSGGLVGFGGFFWLWALGCLTLAINPQYCEGIPGQHDVNLVTSVIVALFPFPLFFLIADTSTWCDNLMDALNEARIKHGLGSHSKIMWLEAALNKLVRLPFANEASFARRLRLLTPHRALCLQNRGQGLGFVLLGAELGTVIDKKTLKNCFVRLYSYLGILVAALQALNTAAVAGGELCALSAKQRDGIQAAANTILDGRDSSCSYSMTFESILAD